MLLGGCRTSPPMKAVGYGSAVHERGAIACVHPLAAQAAVNAYDKGGNAVDAAVAAALTLGVVDGHNSGIGGGCFILIHKKDGTILAIDGREMAPAAATRDMYIRDGKADTSLSQTGSLAIGIPGSLAAYELALKEAGNQTLRDHLLPAADIAEHGFPIDANYASRLRGAAGALAKFEGSRAVLLDGDGKPWPKGHVLKQADLARTYRDIADNGIGFFYGGRFARNVERWMRDHGGIITAKDFADYQVKKREPIITTYRGYTIVGFPPPSSGGAHVAQILNILENDRGVSDPSFIVTRAQAFESKVTRVHLIAEAMKLAFADRAHWLGDPDFTNVPSGLVSKAYAKELWQRINASKASEVKEHGTPPGAGSEHFGKHTTHIAAADAEGNFVASTAPVNTAFGSKDINRGTDGEMTKRPLSSMSPTIVLKDGKPVLTLGAAGGPRIITAVVSTLLYRLDGDLSIEQAVAGARIHHQWRPNELRVERRLDPAIIERLKAMGHDVRVVEEMAVLQAIDAGGRGWTAVSDPRLSSE